jgi:hypothetical protein
MNKAQALRRVRRTLAVVSCAALASLGALSTSAGASSARSAVPSTASASGHFAPYPGVAGSAGQRSGLRPTRITPLAESGNITAGSCTYKQAVDNAHLSGGETSVHGYWLKVSGTCPSTANVDAYLQAYWCDVYGCRWITVASASGDYYAGGGSGRRATARRTCAGTSTTGWRGFVDVDLNGVSDPSGYTYSPPQNLACRPS